MNVGYSQNIHSLSFTRDGVQILKNEISLNELDRLKAEIQLIEELGALNGNDDSEKVGCFYALLPFEAMLIQMQKKIELLVGEKLYPSYTFMWLYKKGAKIPPHFDKPSAEISISLNLGSSSNEPWPLNATLRDGSNVFLDLNPGDMALIDGKYIKHWREPSPLDWRLQVVFFYVRQKDNERLRFDQRGMLCDPPIAANISSPYKRGLKLGIDLGIKRESYFYISGIEPKVK